MSISIDFVPPSHVLESGPFLGLFPFGKEFLHLFNLVIKRSESTLVGDQSVQDDVNPLGKSSKGLVGAIIHGINLTHVIIKMIIMLTRLIFVTID